MTASQYNCESLSVDVNSPFKTRGNFELKICEMNEKALQQLVPVKARKRFVSDLYSPVPASVLQQSKFHTASVHIRYMHYHITRVFCSYGKMSTLGNLSPSYIKSGV